MSNEFLILAIFVLGLLLGGTGVWFVLKSQSGEASAAIESAKAALLEASAKQSQVERDTMLTVAGERFAPFNEQLQRIHSALETFDRNRLQTATEFKAAITAVIEQQRTIGDAAGRLSQQTVALVGALKNPTTRGRWGEIQLRRIVELAGMVEWCDFNEQSTLTNADGRPDLRVNLPAGECVFVDAKTPLSAYLALSEEGDPTRADMLRAEHAKAVRAHVDALAKKAYHKEPGSIGFTVMYVPGEAFLQAALNEMPELIAYAAERDVLLSGPLSLVPLLKSYALGWRERQQEERAREIAGLCADLYDRLMTFAKHFASAGQSLTQTVTRYNNAVGSFESRLVPQAKRIRQAAALEAPECEAPKLIDEPPRVLLSIEEADVA